MERLPPPPPDDHSARPGGNAPVGEMPLFPLNTVLFPNMPLPLHVFEERYKTMVARCLEESRPFGIVLLSEGAAEAEASGGPAAAARRVRTHAVGCAARIAHVERLADGRMNILVVGEQRFRILDTHEREPYRTGITLALNDDPAPDADCLLVLADEVGRLLKDFLSRSLALAGKSIETLDLPQDPEPLSFTTACVLPLDGDEKQHLLETTDTAARLVSERDLLLREVAKLRRAEAARSPEPVTASRFTPYRSRN